MAVTDILITPAAVYNSPVGEALPDETSVAYGTAWGGNWVNLGYTLQPLTMGVDRTLFELMVEQVNGAVKRRVTDEKIDFETVLAEATPTNIQFGTGGTLTTTAAGASQVAFQSLKVGGAITLEELQWGFEGFYENAAGVQFPVRIFAYKCNAILNGRLTMAKAAATGVPLSISTMNDTAKTIGQQKIEIQRVTAVATS
jgi:hypothetical protein